MRDRRAIDATARGLLTALSVIASVHAAPDGDPSVADVYAQSSRSVVVIVAGTQQTGRYAQGSGVVINPAIVVTNCHVLKTAQEVSVVYDEAIYPAPRVLDSNIDRDLCVLEVPGLPAPAIALGSTVALRVGEKVLAIGAPHGVDLGVDLSLSEGLISSLRRTANEAYPIIQTSAPISQGSSGGALLDRNGGLIGITTAVHKSGQNLNFAVPVDWVREFPAAQPRGLRDR